VFQLRVVSGAPTRWSSWQDADKSDDAARERFIRLLLYQPRDVLAVTDRDRRGERQPLLQLRAQLLQRNGLANDERAGGANVDAAKMLELRRQL
jgi:hypothetical protein